jgi:uncharacterized protein
MKHLLTGIVVGVAGLFCLVLPVFGARFSFPDPTGFVNDFADVLTNDSELETKLRAFAESDSTEIFVITVEELPDTVTIDTFIPYLTDEHPKWKAGQEKYDNGIFLTLVTGGAEGERDVRIDTGYGLEGALPDITAKAILENDVIPKLSNGDLDGGVEAGVDSIIVAVRGEYEGIDVGMTTVEESSPFEVLGTCCCVSVFFVFPVLGSILGRTKSWWLGGVLGFFGGFFVAGVFTSFFPSIGWVRFLSFLLSPVIMGIVGLVFDYFVSKTYRTTKGGTVAHIMNSAFGSSRSGGFGGLGGGGFGGGGFGGGSGGSFGGGGASGKW